MELCVSTALCGFDNFDDRVVVVPETATGASFLLAFCFEHGLMGRHLDLVHGDLHRVGVWDDLRDLQEPRLLLVRDHRGDTWVEWFWKLWA